MKNIIFTYPENFEGEQKRLLVLMEDGIDFLHIRKRDFSFGELVQYIGNIPAEFHNRIVVHDHYAIINEYDLAGINLNRKSIGQLVLAEEVDKCYIQPLVKTDLGIEVNRKLAKHVSYSGHSFEEINNLSIDTDYVFLSPIFDSISKVNYLSNFSNHEVLKNELMKSDRDIIALGGIHSDHYELCKELGFKGHARLGDAWGNTRNIEE